MEAPVRPFAVVTGASRGIGEQYARVLAERGYDLLLVARDAERLRALASRLGERHGIRAEFESLDLAAAGAAHELYAAARRRRAAVDLLIHNAGFGLFGPFVDMPMPRIHEMLRLHIMTVVESLRLFLPGMTERRSGAVIAVASVAGLYSVPYFAEYAATKAFLIRFCEALAEEVRPFGVRVQVCCPGSTETEFHRTAGHRPANQLGSQTPQQVVAYSLAMLATGPPVVLTGWKDKALALLSRLLPRYLTTRATARWMKASTRRAQSR